MTKCTRPAKKIMFWLNERELELIIDGLEGLYDIQEGHEDATPAFHDEWTALIKRFKNE